MKRLLRHSAVVLFALCPVVASPFVLVSSAAEQPDTAQRQYERGTALLRKGDLAAASDCSADAGTRVRGKTTARLMTNSTTALCLRSLFTLSRRLSIPITVRQTIDGSNYEINDARMVSSWFHEIGTITSDTRSEVL